MQQNIAARWTIGWRLSHSTWRIVGGLVGVEAGRVAGRGVLKQPNAFVSRTAKAPLSFSALFVPLCF